MEMEKRGFMKQSIGQSIASHRKQNGMSQIELANELARYHIQISNAGVSAWEKGNSTPTAPQLLAICEILGITDIYSEFIGKNPASPFAGLNKDGLQKAIEYIELLRESERYQEKLAEIIPIASRKMKISLLPTSAGTGEFLDNENFEEVDVYDYVPAKADFGVYLNGDSMEPRFHNDELVWIEQTDQLETGEIGLFYYDGMTYFKKLLKNNIGTFLISLNPKYKPIQIGEFATLKIFGRLATD